MLIFPSFPGLTWNRTRSPQINSLLQKSVSGMQTGAQLQTYPSYTYTLEYDVIRAGAPLFEWETLVGFWNQVGGNVDTWLFNDWQDNAVTGQVIGEGDGTTAQFQLYRTLGGFTEPVLACNVLENVYFNGAVQTLGSPPAWSASGGVITFATAPGAEVVVSADFSFYWECRFVDDHMDLDTLWTMFWQLKKIQFNTILLGSG
jgi:uncharacterized protein (TIGR02217 family)